MKELIIADHTKEIKTGIKDIAERLLVITQNYNLDKDIQETLESQISNIYENFLFVIVGEVNAGKSSFVNALLNADISETSHEICTTQVQKITYGDSSNNSDNSGDRIVERTYPVDILKEITVVDTPGTNSRELDHQVITEKFIPICNLVVFVFQVDNIHVQSAWDLFSKIKDKWSKKIIFVLTKSDRYTPEELQNYAITLKRYAQKEGIENPVIFTTSSKNEIDKLGIESGFGEVREFISTNILGNAAILKLKDDVHILNRIKDNIDSEFKLRQEKFDYDYTARAKINEIIKSKEELAHRNIDKLTGRCLSAYDANAERTVKKLKSEIGFFHLTVRSIRSMFGGESSKQVLEQINTDHITHLNTDINQILASGIDNIKSDITYMVIGVKNEIDNLRDLDIQPYEMFSTLDEKRNNILHALKKHLFDFIDKSEVFKGTSIVKNKGIDYTSVNIASGVAAAGTAIAIIIQSSVADITGGIATGLALIVAGGLATFKKGNYIKDVEYTLSEKRELFEKNLKTNLRSYLQEIKNQINLQFKDFDHHLHSEKIILEKYDHESYIIKKELEKIERSTE